MPPPLIFTNVRIFDDTGSPLFTGEVRIKDNCITAVGGTPGTIDRTDAELMEGGGRTLMPGLVEGHAHLTWPSNIGRVINTMRLPVEEHVLVAAQNARITPDHGFTSAYSAGSLGERFEVALRDMIDAAYLPDPRLRASSPEKGAEGVLYVPASARFSIARTPTPKRWTCWNHARTRFSSHRRLACFTPAVTQRWPSASARRKRNAWARSLAWR